MTTTAHTVEEAIQQVARGERPWADLRAFGLVLQPDAGRADNLPPTEAAITAHDLASGFLAYLDDPTALREWAFVMEAVPADTAAIEAHPDGEVVLGALWNASFGQPLSNAEIEVIKALARERGGDA
jgi:hypothetical protein